MKRIMKKRQIDINMSPRFPFPLFLQVSITRSFRPYSFPRILFSLLTQPHPETTKRRAAHLSTHTSPFLPPTITCHNRHNMQSPTSPMAPTPFFSCTLIHRHSPSSQISLAPPFAFLSSPSSPPRSLHHHYQPTSIM